MGNVEQGEIIKNSLINKMNRNTGNLNLERTTEYGAQLKNSIHIIEVKVFIENDNIECFNNIVGLSR
tara:strand:- start:48 stop:248 length:201 start_codon:yes stop_codon:yes gene_type:complete